MSTSQFRPVSGRSRRISRPARQKVRPKKEVSPRRPIAAKKPVAFPKLSQIRLLMVWGVLLLGILGLGWKLYQLQVIQAEELHKKARQQQVTNLSPYVPRRAIIDRDGNVLATDRLIYTLYAHPKLFKIDKQAMAAKLSAILGNVSTAELLDRFERQKSGIRVATRLTEGTAAALKNLSLDGLEVLEDYERYYPQQEMVADAIGYVDRDRQAQAGIERSQRQLLERDVITWPVRREGNGSILPAFLPPKILKSNDWELQLTLDLRLQRAVRDALRQQLKKFNAKRGAAIVMDVTDGSLLALVCEPTFNPNEYYKANLELFKNWAVSDLYEPGSTFKPINVAIGLDEGVFRPNTVVYDGGSVTVDGWNILNASKTGNGAVDIAKILQVSSNVGMVEIMRRLDKGTYYDRLQQLGIDEKTGIDLPGETAGHLKNRATFMERGIEAATAAFGQGLSLTPIKLVQLHGALANGGTLLTPHVVRGLVDSDGRLHWKPNYPSKQVFKESSAREVVKMMETVVTQGSGEPSKIDGYRIGGKTGTAQKAGPRGGYLPNAKITSFVATLPVEAPRYVILAVVDEPKGGNTFGSTVAAPIVKTIIESLIAIQGIPPSQAIAPAKAATEP